MIQRVSAPVSVILAFNHKARIVYPMKVYWEDRTYKVAKVGLHHTYHTGSILYHVFSVTTENLFLRLVLNTENLSWRLEEISDGEPG